MEKTREQIAADIQKFARENKLSIHPGQEPQRWANLVVQKGGCPCVPGRNHCPCEFALADVKELGRCRCGLFCNDGYLKEYSSLKNGRKAKGRWTRRLRVNF